MSFIYKFVEPVVSLDNRYWLYICSTHKERNSMHDNRPKIEIQPTIFNHCIKLQTHSQIQLRNSLEYINSNPVLTKEMIQSVLSVMGAVGLMLEDVQYRYEQKQLGGE